MKSESHRRLANEAARSHGVFSLEQARALGIADRSVSKRAAAGRYFRLNPGVYAIGGTPDTMSRRIAAAVVSFPALAAVSHQTAAELWGMTNRGIRAIEIVTTRWDRVRRDSVKVHESLDLLPEDVVDLDGIPITTPVRTVVDLGASNRWIVERALEEGIRRDLFTLEDVEGFVARVAKRGRRGVGVIRPLLAARRRWDTVTESALEDEFRKLLTDGGLPMPEPQYTVRDESGDLVCRADFAYPSARVLIELDSEAHHLDRVTFRRDRSKQNAAATLGWTVLRYTWWDLTEEPARVCREIESILSPVHADLKAHMGRDVRKNGKEAEPFRGR
jgi:very-short-patch-repair endonuclease